MFKRNFISLCNKKGEAPSVVCRKVGITPATFSGWTDRTVPREATLYRIADYFGVTVEYLLRDEDEKKEAIEKTASAMDDLTEDERNDVLEFIEFIKSKRKDEQS